MSSERTLQARARLQRSRQALPFPLGTGPPAAGPAVGPATRPWLALGLGLAAGALLGGLLVARRPPVRPLLRTLASPPAALLGQWALRLAWRAWSARETAPPPSADP